MNYPCPKCGIPHPVRITVRDRLLSKVPVLGQDECWPFQGAVWSTGYGVLRFGRINHRCGTWRLYAHRAMWQEFNGPIPPGAEVCHSCDNPRCCNPTHLFIGTHKENMQDMVRKSRNPVIGSRKLRRVTPEQERALIDARLVYGAVPRLAREYGIHVQTAYAAARRGAEAKRMRTESQVRQPGEESA